VVVEGAYNCADPDECCSGTAEFSNHCPAYGPLCCYAVGQTGCDAVGGNAACCEIQSGDDIGHCIDDTCCAPFDRACDRNADCCTDEGAAHCVQGTCQPR